MEYSSRQYAASGHESSLRGNGLIDWVDAYGRSWGRVRRKIDMQHEAYPESVGARIQDGIPPDDYRDQKFLEVFEGDALKFSRALRAVTELQRQHIYVHYVVPASIKEKVFAFGCSRANYYQVLAHAHRRIANAIDYGH